MLTHFQVEALDVFAFYFALVVGFVFLCLNQRHVTVSVVKYCNMGI